MNSFLQKLSIALLICVQCNLALAADKVPELLLYCGITMIRPMTEIAQRFEQQEAVKITIAQGGSEDLYQSAKKSGVGEWYLPGEPSYRDKHQAEGLLGDFVTVGYNQMALMVQKGNPKQIKATPHELLRKDVIAIIGNAESGSVGQESKTILDALGIYSKVIHAAAFLAPDSRSLLNAMKKQEADVTLSWRATGYFPENAALLEVIDLDQQLAKPQALLLIQLNSAKYPEQTRRFMQFTAGKEGQAIFRKHGFLDNQTLIDQ
ncbi:molybdenum ABC transporter substrate-binding protein [Chromatium okenii]|uniref:substrate-binding domain-containing protein n=1 Tax=Chromatium okenii TaxID=61644 RepID=UPI001907A2FA|nr:substrate-binding domain-containing protein [Chromatium okenii]MBK1641556.1 molybdenum ABC transporter substrate-binding protein [Chromatium okenii]